MPLAALPTGVSLRSRTEVKSIASYYGLTCGISWTFCLPLMLGSGGLKLLNVDFPVPIFISLGTLGPFVASYLTVRMYYGSWRVAPILPSRGAQWLWVLLAPLLILLCFFVVLPLFVSQGAPEIGGGGPAHWAAS